MRPITKDRILELLHEGWELGFSGGRASRWWMQRKLGHGGESYRVNANSAWALHKAGKIKQVKYGFPTSRYALVEESE